MRLPAHRFRHVPDKANAGGLSSWAFLLRSPRQAYRSSACTLAHFRSFDFAFGSKTTAEIVEAEVLFGQTFPPSPSLVLFRRPAACPSLALVPRRSRVAARRQGPNPLAPPCALQLLRDTEAWVLGTVREG